MGLLTTLHENARREYLWTRKAARWRRLLARHPLTYLFLEVTRRCNLKCAYCGSSCDVNQGADEMPVDQWLSVVRQIAGDFDARKIMVAVTGGEPLLKDGVLDLFRELRALGFPFGMVSNGYRIDAGYAQKLVATGIGSISLSMDAPPEINDGLRGKGASAKVAAAVANLRQAGFGGQFEIISTITRPAVPHLDAMRRHVSSLRVPRWRVAPVMPIGRAAERPELVPGPYETRQILEYVRAARRDRFTPTPEFSEEGYLGNRFEGQVRPYLCQCRAGISIGSVLRDGSIAACPELGPAFVQGHIQHDRFKDVWQKKYRVFRDRSWAHRGPCLDCGQWSRCQGGSLHLYDRPGADFLRCLYLQLRASERPPAERGAPTDAPEP